MAKPKSPKQSNDKKETISATSSAVSSSETKNGAADASAATTAAEARMAARKTARKPEIVKTEPRTNLVPINLEDEIRRFAYLLSERRGFEPGHEAEDWLAAEREIRQRYHQHSA